MKKLLISLLILIIVVAGIVFILNKSNNRENNDGTINIITTVYPVYDFTKQIAGDKANVSMLLSPGVEIHDYEPTPQDIIDIQNANMFLYLGKDLEPWADTVISGLENKNNIFDIAYNIEKIKIEEHDNSHEHEEYDTHIWLDPISVIDIVHNITDELCKYDSKNAEYYREREKIYIEKLNELDKNIRETVNNAKTKKIAFACPFSYSYFVNRYNIEYLSVYDSCGEEAEPSLDKVFNIINQMKENNIHVIFCKEFSSGNIAKIISEETDSKILELHSLHSITNEDIESNKDYISIMYKNLENLKIALQ